MESIPCFQKRATSSQMIRKATLFGKKVCQCHTAYQHIYFLVRVTLTCGAHPKLLRLRIEKFRGSSRRQPSNVKAGRHQCTSHNDLMQRIMFQSNSCHQWLSKMACLWKSRLRRSLKTNVAVQVKSRFVPHRKACPSLVGNNPTWNDSKWTHVIFQGSFTWPGTSLATWTRNFREHVENNPSCSQKKKHTDLNPRPWPMLSEYNPSEKKMDPYCAAATKTSQQSEVWKRLSTMQHEKMFLIRICTVASLFQLVFKKLILTKPIRQWGTKCILFQLSQTQKGWQTGVDVDASGFYSSQMVNPYILVIIYIYIPINRITS